MNTPHSIPAWRAPRAFSLVETVLALGIMSLAITALLGLLPQGIEMSRKAAISAAETRIVDTLVSQLSSVPFASLDAQDKKELNFDDQGVEVANASELADSTYFVRVRVPQQAIGLVLPGARSAEAKMRRVSIQMIQTPLHRVDFDAKKSRDYTTFPVLVAPQAP